MYELITTEKPSSAKHIAEALADRKLIEESINTVHYYNLTHKNKDVVVACAVGHLYGLAEKEKKGLRFTVFDVEWKPVFEAAKSSAFTRKGGLVLKLL